MTIAIIGATGNFGGLTIDALIERGVPAGDVLALGRNTERLAALARRGLRAAAVDLDDVVGTAASLTGVDRLLLVSFGDQGSRVAQHGNAIEAARRAGVPHLIYTSGLHAPTTILKLAADHKATEELVTASGVPATFLRNGWYTENHVQDFTIARQHGVVANSVGPGRIASAPRAEFAEAAAVVLTTPGHQGKAYELSGDVAWSFEEFATTAQELLGTPVRHQVLTPEAERRQLLSFGLDEGTADFLVTFNADLRDGAMAPTPGDLARLIGHPTQPLDQTMKTWL
ncbi:NAD(P)H-binding protein [Actinomadura hibisca]|uniref:NAD(P)H-binding protein n=1 Tax=Actinomadura hibisca TaxID=68565 RepID=UPI000829E23D|nr:NAD(P)H-binding protein [Actinomadura hibisca]